MHPRTAIRAAVIGVLLTSTAAQDRVQDSQEPPNRIKDLPLIGVHTPEESIASASSKTHPRILTRSLPLLVLGWVANGPNAAADMDALAEQIEDALALDSNLGGLVDDLILTSTSMEVIADSDRSVGYIAMTFDITYRTLAVQPPVTLDPFVTANVTQNPNSSVPPTEVAVDSVSLPQV